VCACIERPWQDTPQKREVDRGALADLLLTAVPPGLTPVGAVFGGSAELVGYRLEPAALVPGQRMRLTLVWRCRAELDSWRIFVHLDDTAGSRIHAEHDPAGGRYPTDAWRPGDLVADPIVFTAGTDPDGAYTQSGLDAVLPALLHLTLDEYGVSTPDGPCRRESGGRAEVEGGDGIVVEGSWTCPREVEALRVRVGFVEVLPAGHAHLAK